MKTFLFKVPLRCLGAVIMLVSSSLLMAQTPPSPPSGTNSLCLPGKQNPRENRLRNLTEAERKQLHADLKQIHDAPELLAAKAVVEEAQTKEARQEARRKLQQTRHDLLLKVDPSIEPILDKIMASKHSE